MGPTGDSVYVSEADSEVRIVVSICDEKLEAW